MQESYTHATTLHTESNPCKVLVLADKNQKVAKTKEVAIVPSEIESKDLKQVMANETEKRKLITQFIKKHMENGVDFGTISFGGKVSKPSLFKPGSEKFLSLFKLTATFRKDIETFEMSGSVPGTFCYICELKTSKGDVIGEGRGVTSIKEKNWTINNAVKIAEKRAQIDAVLRTGALSDFFTQDMSEEDYDHEDIPDDAHVIVAGIDLDIPETVAGQRKVLLGLLKDRGVDVKDGKACKQYVADETQLELVETNFVAIIKALDNKS